MPWELNVRKMRLQYFLFQQTCFWPWYTSKHPDSWDCKDSKYSYHSAGQVITGNLKTISYIIISKGPNCKFLSRIDFKMCREEITAALNDVGLLGKNWLLCFSFVLFYLSNVLIVLVPFPFSVQGRMWNLNVSVPQHCQFIYFGVNERMLSLRPQRNGN